MHLLEAALQKGKRSLRWQSLLLLVLRCLIPVLLAIALARPVLTSLQANWARGPQSLALLIDDSLSMGQAPAGDSNNQSTPFSTSIQKCWSILQPFTSSQVLVLASQLSGDRFEPISVNDPGLRTSLGSLQPRSGAFNPVASIRDAVQQLRTAQYPGRHLLIASDFRQSDWQQLTSENCRKIKELAAGGDFPVRISLLPTQPRELPVANLAIHFEPTAGYQYFPNEPVSLVARLTNFGEQECRDIPVTISVDGRQLETKLLAVNPSSSQKVEFDISFPATGWHQIRCHISHEVAAGSGGSKVSRDALKADDEAYWVLQVAERPRVLLVQDARTLGQAASSLQLALAPFQKQMVEDNRFVVQTIGPAQLRTQVLRWSPQIIALNGISRLEQQATETINDFVRNGGGLMVIPEQNLDRDWYRQQFSAALLPCEYGEPVRREEPIGLLKTKLAIPALQVFNGSDAGDLYETRYSNWLKMSPADATDGERAEGSMSNRTVASAPVVVLKLGNGDPLMVMHSFGEGSVVQLSVSLSEQDSNLPLKPVFVPWMQQVLRSMLDSVASPNLNAGDSPAFQIVRSPETESFDVELELQLVDETRQELTGMRAVSQQSDRVSWGRIWQPGGYYARLSPSVSQSLGTFEPGKGNVLPPTITVAASARESDLRMLNEPEIRSIAQQLGANVVSTADDFVDAQETRRSGQELWQALLVTVLLVIFAELFLAKAITKGKV